MFRDIISSFKEFAHLQIPLKKIASGTNNFAEENLIAQTGFGKVFKGQLLHSGQLINVAAQRLDRAFGQGDAEFWTEISMLSRLKHENLITLIGFCDEHGEKIIITKHEIHGSLDEYLSGPTLTWKQRLKICLGAAHALSYMHYDVGRSDSVIHRDFKSSNILLDENWEAKISGFGLSIANVAARRHRLLLAEPCGTFGYVDPVYVRTGGVTDKSDVYSFGVVLFEVLCGRRAIEHNDSLAILVGLHYEKKTLDQIIDPDLRKQMDPQSLSIFSDTAYQCLKEQRTQRPYMNEVVKRLEKALECQIKHENPEYSKVEVEDTSSKHWKVKNLEHLKIPLEDIKLATGNFDEKNKIGGGGYGAVYKAKLNHFDLESSLEGMTNSQVLSSQRKRSSTVAIKRLVLSKTGQGEQEFLTEIEMLTNCKHRNVVSLLGFCDEGPEMMLVYEFACNGSLDKYMGNNDSMPHLTWAQRIKICLDVAHGLDYLHNDTGDKHRIIHRDVKSGNILLGENLEAKIADFGLSRIGPANQQLTYVMTNVAGTDVYTDPEYWRTNMLTKESDVYSFGVVLFEVLCGRLAFDKIYNVDNKRGLPLIARRCFQQGKIYEIIDPKVKGETDESIFTMNKGAHEDSLHTFSKIAYQCLAETQVERPTMETVIKELVKALNFEVNRMDNLKISLQIIKLATQNFSDSNIIGRGGSGVVYSGEISDANGRRTVAAKRLDRSLGQGDTEFLAELEILLEYKHENVIGLVGYCDEVDEKIIVYEHASYGSLDKYLNDPSLTWRKRLEICIDVASGLDFLHGGVVTQERVIHKDIKSSNILLYDDWKAKVTDFGISLISPIYQEMDYVVHAAAGTYGYADPLYVSTGFLTKESDIYSFGVVLFEILCGRFAMAAEYHDERRFLVNLVGLHHRKGNLDELIFDGIRAQIVPKSLSIFSTIAYQCLDYERHERPTAKEIVVQLKKALEFQEDYEIWEPRLPKDYKEIMQMSKTPDIYSTWKKKDLYDMFSKGILLQDGKVLFSLSPNGERNEMISATMFSYENRKSYKRRYFRKSRFRTVVRMFDVSNLEILVKIKTQFLSPGINYGAHLVFKFCNARKYSSKPMYVNLKYKMGKETLHAYFATWRDKRWMTIELCRFLNHEETPDFEVLLQSFSRYSCGGCAIYVEGIEFRATDNLKDEGIEKLKEVEEVLKSTMNMDHVQQMPISLMLPAKKVLYDSSNMKCFNWKHLPQSRFGEVVELLSHQVFRIKCKVQSPILSHDTQYACYLVFKLSEKCHGLHCPVKVLDLHHGRNKETELLYFRPPSPLNLHDINRFPKQRKDEWMEVDVWKFNSNYEHKNDRLFMDLKLISYEGTMSGLIVCGLDIRPM